MTLCDRIYWGSTEQDAAPSPAARSSPPHREGAPAILTQRAWHRVPSTARRGDNPCEPLRAASVPERRASC